MDTVNQTLHRLHYDDLAGLLYEMARFRKFERGRKPKPSAEVWWRITWRAAFRCDNLTLNPVPSVESKLVLPDFTLPKLVRETTPKVGGPAASPCSGPF